MSRILDELLQSAAAGVEALGARLDALGNALTPALAKEASEAYKRAIENQQNHTALGGTMVASMLHLKLGNWNEALAGHFDMQQILFVQAESLDDYQSVHEGVRGIFAKALQIGDAERAYEAVVLAADAAYFASEAAGADLAQKEKWLGTALVDLVSAFNANPAQQVSQGTGTKLVSVLCAVADALRASGLDSNPKLAALLSMAASRARASVPPNFGFPGNAQKTAWMQRTLASLS